MKQPEVLPQIRRSLPPQAPRARGVWGLFRCSLLLRTFEHNSNRIAIDVGVIHELPLL